MPQQYRKRPVVVEVSEPFDGTRESVDALVAFAGAQVTVGYKYEASSEEPVAFHLQILTTEGPMSIPEGWRIIRGVEGEFYPCSPTVFEKTYDLVGDEPDDIDPLLVTGTEFRQTIAQAVARAQGVAVVTPHQQKITHAVLAAIQGLYPAYVSDGMVAAFKKGWAAVDEATGGRGLPGVRTRAGLTMALATVVYENVRADWAGYAAARKLEDAQTALAGGSIFQVPRARRATSDKISMSEAMLIMDEAIDEAEDIGDHPWESDGSLKGDLCTATVQRGDGRDVCGRPTTSKWHVG